MKTKIWVCFFCILACLSCKKDSVNNLGNNFNLLEGDNIQDSKIVFCTAKSGNECYAGIPVIPSRKDTLSLYVSKVKSNNNWIVAETFNTDKSNSYWIIKKEDYTSFKKSDLDSIIQTNVNGPLTKNDFLTKKNSLKILINF